jgi:transposase
VKAEEKLARGRLSVLELAEALGNVSEACRRRGISRTQFYEYKRRFQRHGIEGLKDLPPVHKSHPMATPEDVQEKIVALSLSRPVWGCNRVSDQLKLEGVSVSAPTVQNILNKEGLGTRYERWLKLEEKTAEKESSRRNRWPSHREAKPLLPRETRRV